MRILILSILTIATTTLWSQSTETEFYRAVVKLRTVGELESYGNKFVVRKNYDEQLNLGVTQTNWFVLRGKKSLGTQLITLSVGGQIFYSEFYHPKLTEDVENWTYKQIQINIDSLGLESVREEKEIIVDFGHIERHPNRSTFGYACYASGSMPEEGQRMLKFVQNKDVPSLAAWITSINPVKQVYAYLGLKLLQETDSIQLPEELINQMAELENSSMLVYSCSGCTEWDHLPIKEHLSAENVTRFLEHNGKTR